MQDIQKFSAIYVKFPQLRQCNSPYNIERQLRFYYVFQVKVIAKGKGSKWE